MRPLARLRFRFAALLLLSWTTLVRAEPRELAHAEPRRLSDPWPRYRVQESSPIPETQERRGFLVGGLGLWSDQSALLNGSWSVGGGATLPLDSWSVVPRVDWEGGGDEYSSGWMVRSTIGGRLPTEVGSRHTYLEGGLGIAHFETTVRGDPAFGIPSRVHSGTRPCFELASGITSAPEARPGFILEAQTVIANGSDAPSVILGRVGILF